MSNATVQVGSTENLAPGKDIVRAMLGGTMGPDDTKLVGAWAEGLGQAVKKLHDEKGQKVGVLIDLRTLQTYTDPEILPILAKLMKEDDALVYRTATFGGNVIHEMVEKIISSMSGRNNLKNFKTEEEALSWLRE